MTANACDDSPSPLPSSSYVASPPATYLRANESTRRSAQHNFSPPVSPTHLLPAPTNSGAINDIILRMLLSMIHSATHFFLLFRKLFASILHVISTIFNLAPWFYCNRFIPSSYESDAAERGAAGEFNVLWEDVARAVIGDWTIIATGSSGLFSVVVTVLQVQPVSTNSLFTTFVVAALALIFLGVMCAIVYIGYRRAFMAPAMAAHWCEALAARDARLWRLVALPLSFILWAGMAAIAAIVPLAWSDIGGPQSGDSSDISPGVAARLTAPVRGTAITVILAVGAWKIHAARKTLLEMASR